MRYRVVEYQGGWYGLRNGETVEQLAALYPEYAEAQPESLLWLPIGGSTRTRYLILTEYGLADHSQIKRKHRKKSTQTLCDTESKPLFGPGSGRAGGGRGATHYRSHIAGGWVPEHIKPQDCYICLGGLDWAMGLQWRNHTEDALPWKKTPFYPPDESEVCI